jgi:hypothetical protein
VALALEPDSHPVARPFKRALVEDGIPFTSFLVDDVRPEYERLRAAGVRDEPCRETAAAPPKRRAVRPYPDGWGVWARKGGAP